MDDYSAYAEAYYRSLSGDNLILVRTKLYEGMATGRSRNRSLKLALSYIGVIVPV